MLPIFLLILYFEINEIFLLIISVAGVLKTLFRPGIDSLMLCVFFVSQIHHIQRRFLGRGENRVGFFKAAST